MQSFSEFFTGLGQTAISKLIPAIVVLVVGIFVIKALKRVVGKLKGFSKLDPTVQAFMQSVLSFVLYAVLIIVVIGILGVPAASIIAVLASAGLAVGLALQGALSNFAGGLMVLIFKPFRVGDYIVASGNEGMVADINIFYTVLTTVDNKRVTVPNGALMNASIVNCSAERARRVDVDFKVAVGSDAEKVKKILISAAQSNESVLQTPEPFARLTKMEENALVFTMRAWCKTDDYWDVMFDLTEKVNAAFTALGIQPVANKVIVEQ